MEDDQKRQGKERHAEPVHKGSARRAPEAAKPAGEISEVRRKNSLGTETSSFGFEMASRFCQGLENCLISARCAEENKF